MDTSELTLPQRLEIVRGNIAAAASGPVTLVGVTKTKPTEMIRTAIEAGITDIGENYVQEIRDKGAEGAYEGARVHMIGHLQTNKVKYVVGKVSLIQSVDSVPLMQAIAKKADTLGIRQKILLEINIGAEDSKTGITPEMLDELLASAGQLPGIRICGLMAIPPAGNSAAYFSRMYQLYVDNKAKKYDNVNMEILSMGMSDDYVLAIKEGANMVRVGSFLFGARNYNR